MHYVDFAKLEQIDPAAYQATRPYPWVNPQGILTDEAFAVLTQNLPPLALFASSFGRQRKNQQSSHDRYILEYHTALSVDQVWHDAIEELRSERYKAILCRLLGVESVALNFHWHYTPDGCVVSPHADSTRKAGSHIFYLNQPDDWREEWGGQTVILDDAGSMSYRSSPAFEDFAGELVCQTFGNRSLLFSRTDHAWHGVRPVSCPEGAFRKVFIVVINNNRLSDRVQRLIKRRGFHYY